MFSPRVFSFLALSLIGTEVAGKGRVRKYKRTLLSWNKNESLNRSEIQREIKLQNYVHHIIHVSCDFIKIFNFK